MQTDEEIFDRVKEFWSGGKFRISAKVCVNGGVWQNHVLEFTLPGDMGLNDVLDYGWKMLNLSLSPAEHDTLHFYGTSFEKVPDLPGVPLKRIEKAIKRPGKNLEYLRHDPTKY